MIWITYEVEGSGEFPFDMLRFDGSHPVRPEDSGMIAAQGRRRVRLRAYRATQHEADFVPEADRWRSFCWSVDPESVKRE